VEDWNVIVSVCQGGYRRAFHALQKLGPVERSPYYNVLVMNVENPILLLEAVEQQTERNPALYDAISRVAPARNAFRFHSVEEFKDKAKTIMGGWTPLLAGKSFHVRLRRRGAGRELHAPDVERDLDEALLDKLEQAGTPGKISFSDADAVIAIDTLDDWAGIALWTREELARHHLLRPD
jgi:tRNA(Ser,Leu) C12 N-acetylase TAN1